MSKKILILCLSFTLAGFVAGSAFAKQPEPLTQESFAVQLIKNMKLQDLLPLAALPSDCVSLLEKLGISPLKGWDRKAALTEDDYTVIVAKAVGKEKVVYTKAAQVCQRTVTQINMRWQQNPNLTLEQLLNDKGVFPQGRPRCPFGLKYKSQDHKVNPHYHPTTFFRNY